MQRLHLRRNICRRSASLLHTSRRRRFHTTSSSYNFTKVDAYHFESYLQTDVGHAKQKYIGIKYEMKYLVTNFRGEGLTLSIMPHPLSVVVVGGNLQKERD